MRSSDQLSPRSVLAKISPSVVPAKKPKPPGKSRASPPRYCRANAEGECFPRLSVVAAARDRRAGRHRSYARRRERYRRPLRRRPRRFPASKTLRRISNPHLGVVRWDPRASRVAAIRDAVAARDVELGGVVRVENDAWNVFVEHVGIVLKVEFFERGTAIDAAKQRSLFD